MTTALLATAATSSISGTSVSPEGTPVSGAWISAIRLDAPDPTLTKHTLTGTDGRFDFPDLTAGRYRLCFQLPTSEYLNPCVWSVQQKEITLSEGQRLLGEQMDVKRGIFLRIRIHDPQKRLKRVTPKGESGKQPDPLLGVWAPNGLFLPLDMAAEDEDGKNFQLLVPMDTPLRLSIGSGPVQLQDDKRGALPAEGSSIELKRTSSDAHHNTLVLTVKP